MGQDAAASLANISVDLADLSQLPLEDRYVCHDAGPDAGLTQQIDYFPVTES